MGRYRARDLSLPPSLLSFARVPLAAAFVWLAQAPAWALGVLLLAGITDVLDGYLARRLGQATATGAVVDGVLDKLFAAVVVGGLVYQGRLPWLAAGLLATRELGELPLVAWWAIHENGRRARAEDPRANWLGKAATVCQFIAIASLLVRGEPSYPWLVISAVIGAVSAVAYWKRELRASRVTDAGTQADAINELTPPRPLPAMSSLPPEGNRRIETAAGAQREPKEPAPQAR